MSSSSMDPFDDPELIDDFVKLAEQKIKEVGQQLRSTLNNILVFAALFTAVNTGILALSIPTLSPGPSDETDRLLRLLISNLVNGTTIPASALAPPVTDPSKYALQANRIFSASLVCSLLAAFGAMIGIQWLTAFTEVDAASVLERRRDLQRTLDGMDRWCLRGFVDVGLLSLTQLTVVLFVLGYVPYIHWQGGKVSFADNGLSWFGAGMLVFTTLFALWDPWCPFATPLTRVVIPWAGHSVVWVLRSLSPSLLGRAIWWLFQAPKCIARAKISPIFLVRRLDDEDAILDVRSLCWMLQHTRDTGVLRRVARAITLVRDPELATLLLTSEDAHRVPHLYGYLKHLGMLKFVREGAASPERRDLPLLSGDAAFLGGALCHLRISEARCLPCRLPLFLMDAHTWMDILHEIRVGCPQIMTYSRSRYTAALRYETPLHAAHLAAGIGLLLQHEFDVPGRAEVVSSVLTRTRSLADTLAYALETLARAGSYDESIVATKVYADFLRGLEDADFGEPGDVRRLLSIIDVQCLRAGAGVPYADIRKAVASLREAIKRRYRL
ncbi:hypothetical protein EWM64_g6062 [Hericium alpestre]|uniref:DUF6535 domain-containing protein n=1 Tax=Hericium alpestre TaxID=135208 RepID=A0A4Y9ZVP0_9AGAM|nr:hypothetical protein EWM64_g6062 [Hericium alpestre]